MNNKILFFIGASYIGGSEIVTLNLIMGLKAKGYDIQCILNGWNDGDFKNRLNNINIKSHEIKLGWLHLKKPLWTVDTLIHYPAAYIKCKKIITDFKPDIFHFSSFATPVMLYPLITGKSIYCLHETNLPSLKYKIIYRLLSKKISVFVGVSLYIVENLKRLPIPAKKIKLIYNGILLPENIYNGNDNGGVSQELNFAIIGQIIVWKGHEVLIDAVEALVHKGVKNFKVFVFGNDKSEYGNKLKNIVAKKNLQSFFLWKGFVKNTDELYKVVDVVVIPSLCEEAFSLTTAEGMIRGLGIIAAESGGIKELIQHKYNGLLFPINDANELSNCMENLIIKKQKIAEMGERAKDKATNQFTQQIMTQQYINLFNSLN